MKSSDINRKVAVALLAHPDDAEILCAGALIRLAQAGWEIHIVIATPGDCGSATLPTDEIAAIRRGEAASSAALIGATYHCLEERDVNVIFDRGTNRKAIDLFRQIAPTLVLTHPRHDYMLDHEQVHLLARQHTPPDGVRAFISESAAEFNNYFRPLANCRTAWPGCY